MPTKRFSTRSSRPMPCLPPSSLSLVSSSAGDSVLPLTETAIALLEADGDDLGLVGRLLGIDGALRRRSRARAPPDPRAPCPRTRCGAGWRRPRTALRRACPWRSGSGAFRHSRAAAVRERRSHSRHGAMTLRPGFERVGGQLEADLVVALAGRAMGDGVGAGLLGDLDEVLGDHRAGDRGAEQVLALIERVGAEHREHEVAHELLAHIDDADVLDAEHLGLLARRLELLALAEVGGEGDDLGLIVLLQPLQHDRGVEAAGIGEDDLLDVFAHLRAAFVGPSGRGRTKQIGANGARLARLFKRSAACHCCR